MASCYGDGCCRVWDARTWRLLGRLKGAHASPCYGAAKTDGFVASWAAEGLAFWSCEDALRKADATKKAAAPITDSSGNAVPLFQCAFSSSHIVVCGGAGGKGDAIVPSVFVYDLESRKRGRNDEEAAGEKRPRESFFVWIL